MATPAFSSFLAIVAKLELALGLVSLTVCLGQRMSVFSEVSGIQERCEVKYASHWEGGQDYLNETYCLS